MTFLPIVTRELRVAARKQSTYWIRTGAGLLVVALGTWLFLLMQGKSQRDLSLALFYVLSGSAVFYAISIGMRSTADTLSEEKREGTLGLLFLTDLRGADVVIGKLAANSVHAFYSAVAVLPMLAIPLLLGGVTGGEFARIALLVINALFFSLTAGLVISACSRIAQRALLGSLLLVLFFNVCLPAVGALLAISGRTRTVSTVFLLPSAGFSFYGALDSVYRMNPEGYWISMALIHGLGWVCLMLACFIAPRTWQDKARDQKPQGWRERWKRWSYGELAERTEFRQRLLKINAFYWLASRERLKPALVWAFLVLVGCGWAWGLAKAGRAWLEPGMYLTTAYILNFVLRCWLASEAARQLAEERKQGTLELLLSAPLTVEEILHGQRLALVRQFLGPVILVLGIEVVFLMGSMYETSDSEQAFVFFIYLGGMLMFLIDLVALYWVGMWLAMVSKDQSHATSGAVARILVLPWGALALLALIAALAPGQSGSDPGGTFFLIAWFLIGLGADAGFALTAKRRLLTQFRTVAQQRFAPRPGFWRRLFLRES